MYMKYVCVSSANKCKYMSCLAAVMSNPKTPGEARRVPRIGAIEEEHVCVLKKPQAGLASRIEQQQMHIGSIATHLALMQRPGDGASEGVKLSIDERRREGQGSDCGGS
jgi:hypothetical protein